MHLSAEECQIPAEHAAALVDPVAYASGRIFETYEWLQTNQPLGVASPPGFDPFWVATRHQDVIAISRDNELFPYGDRSSILIDQINDQRQREATGRPYFVRSLVQIDEPEHMALRRITQPWFMPARVKQREADIVRIAERTVDKLLSFDGTCDFARDIALNYPLEVVMNILGVPPEDFDYMLKLTQETFGPSDPETARKMASVSAAELAEMALAVVSDFQNYFNALADERRKNPRDDLATLLANATIDEQPLTQEQQTGYFMIVATAGHDTTSSSTAGGMWALANCPGLLEQLQQDPSLIPAFVEESIRWTSPVRHFMRSPSRDTVVANRQLNKDDWLMLCYASANRDPEVFASPNEFRIDRANNAHLAFGHGAHLCLGMHLARLEMRLLWEQLIPRLRSVSPAGPARYVEATFVTGAKCLPIRFEAA